MPPTKLSILRGIMAGGDVGPRPVCVRPVVGAASAGQLASVVCDCGWGGCGDSRRERVWAVRRTQDRRVELHADIPLARQQCRRCPSFGLAVIVDGANDSGAISLGWCSTACATLDGWPWLRSRRDPAPDPMQGRLFCLSLPGMPA